ncbi:hypothetical protein F0562_020910, partial [Nyssa sinensis]
HPKSRLLLKRRRYSIEPGFLKELFPLHRWWN